MTARLPRPADLPEASREARRRALHVLSLMRVDGMSFTHALRTAHTTRETAQRYAGRALTRTTSGRYRAKPWDRLPRAMQFYTGDGKIALEVRDSRSASRIGGYMAAVDEFLKTGSEDVLRRYRGKAVVVDRVGHPFITNPTTLERLAAAGEVSFENIYV